MKVNNNLTSSSKYEALDFGTTPTTSELLEVKVMLSPETMVKPYAKSYHNELYRRNPVKAQAVGLTEDDLYFYFSQLLLIRVQQVNDTLMYWRQAKALYIPDWIQFTLTQVGYAIDRNKGFKFVPVLDGEVDMNKCLDISNRIQSFEIDNVGMSHDAFPRETSGDLDTMSMAVIDGYVKGVNVSHPISSYVSAFIGAKIMEEQAFSMIYRVRYDDVDFIAHMLLNTKEIY